MAGWRATAFRQISFDEHWSIDTDSNDGPVVAYVKEVDVDAGIELRTLTGATTRVKWKRGAESRVLIGGNVAHYRVPDAPGADRASWAGK